MTIKDITTDNILSACTTALEALEGANLYTSGPYPFTIRPFADPMSVIYWAADNESYERPFTLEMQGDALNAVLGERTRVESQTLWLPVETAAAASAFSFSQENWAGKTTWKGLIFRAGNYPDKCGEVKPEMLRLWVKNFQPHGVQLIDTHYDDTFIQELLKADDAKMVRVWTENGDTELHGEVEVPGWFAYAARNFAKKVSIGLTQGLDAIREISICLNPRIPDAAVFQRDAALGFSKSDAVHKLSPAIARRVNELAITATNPAPAPRTGLGDPTMTFAEKIRLVWPTLTPEQREASGLTEAEINNPANFAAAPTTADPRDLAFANLRADQAFDALLAGRKITAASKDNFRIAFTALLRSDGGGSVKFSTGGTIVEGDASKALLSILAETHPQFTIGEKLPVDFSNEDGKNTLMNELDKGMGIKEVAAGGK